MNLLLRSLKRLLTSRKLTRLSAELAAARDYLGDIKSEYEDKPHTHQHLAREIITTRKAIVKLETERNDLLTRDSVYCRVGGLEGLEGFVSRHA